jgi:hypothetical protein
LGRSPNEVLYDRVKTEVIAEAETGGIIYSRALVDL